jgi:hypothetical protein
MTFERAREAFTLCCTRNERSGLAWFKKVFGIEREEERIRESMMPIIYRGGRCCTYITKCSETIN